MKKEILEPLDLFIRENNPYGQLYKSMGDLEAEVTASGGSIKNYALKFHERRGRDAGRYNAPQVEKVAVVFDLRDGALPPKQALVVHHRLPGENQSIFMPIVSQHHDSCCYPLLFPYGNMGWNEGLPLARRRGGISCVSFREYERFHFHQREDVFNSILCARNLMQQIAVDAFVQIESRSISFLTGARPHMRISKISDVTQAVAGGAANLSEVGVSFQFPTDFIGSDGYMRERFHDAMELVTRFGIPDNFFNLYLQSKVS